MPEKTPDEIKKGLECLDKMQFFMGQRAGRELWMEKPKDVQEKDIESYNRDIKIVRNLIQQLEAENHQLLTKVKQLETKCQQLERERDAAVKDIEVDGVCGTCKYLDFYEEKCPCDQCVHIGRGLNSHWQWRGVKESKPNIIELLQADNTKELLEKIEQLIIERDEAYEAICGHCMDIPCQENECYWYRKMNQTEETKS